MVGDGSEVYTPRLRYLLIAMEKYKPADLQGSNLMALLIRLERSRTRSGLRQIIRDLVDALPGSDEGGLRRAFVVWLQRVLLPAKGEEDIPEMIDLEDFRTMLIERVEEWSREIEARAEKKWLKKGQEKGSRELLLRQLEVRFGPIDDRTQAKVNAAGRELLLRWAERLLTAERLADVFGR